MFYYYGMKRSYIDKYPPPEHKYIVEPFAGSATYAMKYWDSKVILCEKDERLYDIWDYLINKATKRRILSFPILKMNDDINDTKFNNLKQVEKDIIGYFMQYGSYPSHKPTLSKGFNKWNEVYRERLANDISKVKHWKIYNRSYEEFNNKKATWFIDPPYQGKGGSRYRCNNKDIDYKHLGKWCKSRKGQVIVCENEEANWLPFKPLINKIQAGRKHTEMIYLK